MQTDLCDRNRLVDAWRSWGTERLELKIIKVHEKVFVVNAYSLNLVMVSQVHTLSKLTSLTS